eukprot:CAMPEP_0194226922 /NCGR_PEP_ID=MMETSP0156-20130528/42590_1 /TAXON_ID=33649 /ORGANISM="Thalassionema nitzschioides, Strain L26-B" /LENGTH=413 /DNA_ID=CAMNT_0038959389 /DNA_START=267 /DNA_END=1508 /DNA_ORIENTATION=-
MPLKSCLSKGNLRDLATGNDSGETKLERNVSFCNIEVREYEQTLSDNPCVSKGPAIGLDWNYEEAGCWQVDDYELSKGPQRRTRGMMLVPPFLRERQLRQEWDVTSEEIRQMQKKVRKQKLQRYKSSHNPESVEKTLDVFHTATRKFSRRLSSLVKKKNNEEELLKEYKLMMDQSSISKRQNRIKSCNDLQLMSKQLQSLGDSNTDEELQPQPASSLSRRPMAKSMVDLSTFNKLEEEEEELLKEYKLMMDQSSISKRQNRIKSCNDLQLMSKQLQSLEDSNTDNTTTSSEELQQQPAPSLSRRPMAKSMVDLSTFNKLEEEEGGKSPIVDLSTFTKFQKEEDKSVPNTDNGARSSQETEDTSYDDWGFDFEEEIGDFSSQLQPFAMQAIAETKDTDIVCDLDSSARRKALAL